MPKSPREKPIKKDITKITKETEEGIKTEGVSPEEIPEVAVAAPIEAYEKVISVNRCAKVVKGGKRFSFAALVVVGNGQGEVGYAIGKANEVADAIRKATVHARKNFFRIPMKGTTIPHEVLGHYGAGKVILKPAAPGTGIIAGGPVRALCQAGGIKDILTKSLGSSNAINVIKAAAQGFQSLMLARKMSGAVPEAHEVLKSDESKSSLS